MRAASTSLVLAAAIATLAGCPSPTGLTLFVATVNGETNVRLVDVEPDPF